MLLRTLHWCLQAACPLRGPSASAVLRKTLIPYIARFHLWCSHCRHALSRADEAIATEHLDQTNHQMGAMSSVVAEMKLKQTVGKEGLSLGEFLGNAMGAAGSLQ